MSKPLTTYTVGKLLEVLKDFPQDAPVVVSGYESGYEDMMPPRLVKLEHHKENKYWDGEFQQTEQEGENTLDGVVLNRVRRDD